MSMTFSGYLVALSANSFTSTFDASNLASGLGLLPLPSGFSGVTLSGFLNSMASGYFVANNPEALSAGSLEPGENIPDPSSGSVTQRAAAGMIVVEALLGYQLSPKTPVLTKLPQAVLERLNQVAVDRGFG